MLPFWGSLVMSAARDTLVELLLSAYPDLKRWLAGRLGSSDLAGEALQDTYVRLQRTENLDNVRNPKSYLLRMAINIANNRLRAERRHLSAAEVEALIDIPDDAPDPLRVAEARSELEAVKRALSELPPRRSAIFRRIWVDGASYEEIATEFNISVRTARHELLLATRSLHEATQGFSVAVLQKRLAHVSSQ